MAETPVEPTVGEKRVRTSFNPSDSSDVSTIKQRAAELINIVMTVPFMEEGNPNFAEVRRLQALAATAIEQGAMWAVKAATTGK